MQQVHSMRFLVLMIFACTAVRVASAQSTDLPNANLPGNSPTLPNSNLPGSMPTSNPITLPNTDTTPATIPWYPNLYPEATNVPARNPTTPAPAEARSESPNAAILRALEQAQTDARNAQQEAAQARDDAAGAKEEAAKAVGESAALREQLAREHEEQAQRNAPRQR